MASPLVGVAGVNSLLFASNAYARKLVSPYPNLSIGQVALAGSMAGAVQSILASPVEMFKIRMQGQYGAEGKKRLREVVGDMYREWGWRRGIMRGFWVSRPRHSLAFLY
jgi:solute carrier family 25 carnitine/acylcarnitine transporter 20/29